MTFTKLGIKTKIVQNLSLNHTCRFFWYVYHSLDVHVSKRISYVLLCTFSLFSMYFNNSYTFSRMCTDVLSSYMAHILCEGFLCECVCVRVRVSEGRNVGYLKKGSNYSWSQRGEGHPTEHILYFPKTFARLFRWLCFFFFMLKWGELTT